MPNYITVEELKAGLSQLELTQLTTDEAEVMDDTEMVEQTIDQAESLIDTYLSAQVAVPLSNPSPFIQAAAITLTKYYLFLRRHHVPEDIQLDYDRLLKCTNNEKGILVKMSEGELPINPTDQTGASGVAYGSEARAFNNELSGVQ